MSLEVTGRKLTNNIFTEISDIMVNNRDILISLDSAIGDGDLGLTMVKAFSVAAQQVPDMDEELPGQIYIAAGKLMASNAPSTMGTLMATGFMYGGKAIGDAKQITGEVVYLFFKGFLEGVIKRGKAKSGEKTLIDVLDPVVKVLEIERANDISHALEAALIVAKEGLEATKDMISQHGKAAVYREQTLGKQDPGATAMFFVIQGFVNAVRKYVGFHIF